MESVKNPQPDPAIKPLTGRTKQGRLYRRPDEVEAQIHQTLTLPPKELLSFARLSNSEDPRYLKEETLVYLILAYRQAGNRDMASDLSGVLAKRVVRIYRVFFHGFTPTQRAEAGDELLKEIFIRILNNPDGKSDYFQIRFWACLKRLAVSHFLKKAKDYNQEESSVPLSGLAGYEIEVPEDDKGDDDERPLKSSSLLSLKAIAVEDVVTANDGLQHLPEPLRTAYLLYHGQGWEIESKDPSEPTISKYFDVTPKTIRNWLTRAENVLKTWRGGSHGK